MVIIKAFDLEQDKPSNLEQLKARDLEHLRTIKMEHLQASDLGQAKASDTFTVDDLEDVDTIAKLKFKTRDAITNTLLILIAAKLPQYGQVVYRVIMVVNGLDTEINVRKLLRKIKFTLNYLRFRWANCFLPLILRY